MRYARPFLMAVAALLVALGSGAAAGAAPNPELRLSPTAGRMGASVQVVGTGFCGGPKCSPITIVFAHEMVAGGVIASGNGSFATEFSVPGTISGGTSQVEADQTDGRGNPVRAYTSFYVTISQQTPGGAQQSLPTVTSVGTTPPTLRPTTTSTTVKAPTPRSTAATSAAGPSPGQPSSGPSWAVYALIAAAVTAVAALVYAWWSRSRLRTGPNRP